jgi:hypothetical protein
MTKRRGGASTARNLSLDGACHDDPEAVVWNRRPGRPGAGDFRLTAPAENRLAVRTFSRSHLGTVPKQHRVGARQALRHPIVRAVFLQ